MSDTTRGWILYAFSMILLYAGISFTQLNSDFTIWSTAARTILVIGAVLLYYGAMFLADPPTKE
ncbi:hypothetical protein LLH06_00400 [Mucilaginibacter daejeonensis]|uniref:hypothetical protein n=1 Tax=Mucilaginibacter daejeonensis TaxID=398049 RepID=UPI001D172BE0|nr:hypothetical protein [Mucilaginibacter daejeonensis]UEG53437.1 hypothetical protein LLH06_00400 [Mucilaginibacter daejeonensis]